MLICKMTRNCASHTCRRTGSKLALASSKGHDVHGGVSAGTAQSNSWHVENKYCGKVGQGIASSLLQMSEHEKTIQDTNQHTLRRLSQKIPGRPIYNVMLSLACAYILATCVVLLQAFKCTVYARSSTFMIHRLAVQAPSFKTLPRTPSTWSIEKVKPPMLMSKKLSEASDYPVRPSKQGKNPMIFMGSRGALARYTEGIM